MVSCTAAAAAAAAAAWGAQESVGELLAASAQRDDLHHALEHRLQSALGDDPTAVREKGKGVGSACVSVSVCECLSVCLSVSVCECVCVCE